MVPSATQILQLTDATLDDAIDRFFLNIYSQSFKRLFFQLAVTNPVNFVLLFKPKINVDTLFLALFIDGS